MNKETKNILPNVLEMINIITRQTDYDEDTALEKLKDNNYDPISVIRNFMGPKKEVSNNISENKTLNQRVYHEMRTMLDSANATYRAKKEREEELENQMRQDRHMKQIENID